MLGNLFSRARLPLSGVGANETTGISIYDWAKMFRPGAQLSYQGNNYQAYQVNGSGGGTGGSYGNNAVVFSCLSTRSLLFSEARFQFQSMRNGRPGNLFGNQDLLILEEPWIGATTRDMLVQVEMDVADSGNSYWVRDGDSLVRVPASSMQVLTVAATDSVYTGRKIGEKLIGYVIQFPGEEDPVILPPTEVVHHKPYPDMSNRFVGMSWLSPCLPDIGADEGFTAHKTAAISNGASLQTVVSFDPTVSFEQFEKFVNKFQRDHEGVDNHGKTLFLGAGADVKTVSQSFADLALAATQAATETRIAACSGVPPTILGFSEGLKGSSLNAGNYGQARRRLVDGTMRPLWGFLASALESVVPVPGGSRLWYDDRDIAFLREDVADIADITSLNSQTISGLIAAGYEPDSAVQAVLNDDLSYLTGAHTGLTSVQLQPPQKSPAVGSQP